MSEDPKTVDDIVAEMLRIADIVERNLAQQPGAKTVAQTRRIERKLRAEEIRVLAKRIGEAIKRERIQRDKVSFRCGDCARFGNDCNAGDVDGNEDSVACERFARLERETVTNSNGLGNMAKMRKALEAVDQSVSGCSPLLGGDPILKQVVKAALAAPARNCDVCTDAQVANARFQKMCDGRGNGLKACTGCKYNDTPDGFPAISRCRVSWLYDTAEVAQ